jgi:hypothetical protein
MDAAVHCEYDELANALPLDACDGNTFDGSAIPTKRPAPLDNSKAAQLQAWLVQLDVLQAHLQKELDRQEAATVQEHSAALQAQALALAQAHADAEAQAQAHARAHARAGAQALAHAQVLAQVQAQHGMLLDSSSSALTLQNNQPDLTSIAPNWRWSTGLSQQHMQQQHMQQQHMQQQQGFSAAMNDLSPLPAASAAAVAASEAANMDPDSFQCLLTSLATPWLPDNVVGTLAPLAPAEQARSALVVQQPQQLSQQQQQDYHHHQQQQLAAGISTSKGLPPPNQANGSAAAAAAAGATGSVPQSGFAGVTQDMLDALSCSVEDVVAAVAVAAAAAGGSSTTAALPRPRCMSGVAAAATVKAAAAVVTAAARQEATFEACASFLASLPGAVNGDSLADLLNSSSMPSAAALTSLDGFAQVLGAALGDVSSMVYDTTAAATAAAADGLREQQASEQQQQQQQQYPCTQQQQQYPCTQQQQQQQQQPVNDQMTPVWDDVTGASGGVADSAEDGGGGSEDLVHRPGPGYKTPGVSLLPDGITHPDKDAGNQEELVVVPSTRPQQETQVAPSASTCCDGWELGWK